MSVFDIECDSLTPTKIHCLVYFKDGKYVALTKHSDMRLFLLSEQTLIGHNIIRYDIPSLSRLLNVDITAKLVDTLALSWTLYPDRNLHGLASWGEDYGVPKPVVEDWVGLSVEEYIHRCTEDVKINTLLWKDMWRLLKKLYDDETTIWKYIDYITFKMQCAREQEKSKWKLDVNRAADGLGNLEREKADKIIRLGKAMPAVSIFAKRNRPARPFKKDGTLSVTGARWRVLLRKTNLPNDYDGTLQELVGTKEPNPNSSAQIKDWLYSLGWKPVTFKYVRDKETNDVRAIPQVNLEHGGGICDSIKLLYNREPALELLDGLSILSHRISILKGFLEAVDDDGYIKAEIQGLTNTLRFKHKVAVNLPGVGLPYGELIRGCLMADEGWELCGSDMSGLEDRLKQHYIYKYDPDYVNEMNVPDYDPHLSLALLAKRVTGDQVAAYKAGTDKSIKGIRHTFKQGNYACQYGAMPPRLALTANINLKEAKEVWETYWKKNWAIKEVAKNQIVKTLSDGTTWLLNPINHFYYSLRSDKDRFSTLVQGTAAYVFDMWVQKFFAKRKQLTAQFHDEVVLCIRKGHREECIAMLKEAIADLNDELKLNRLLDVDVQFGDNYAQIH